MRRWQALSLLALCAADPLTPTADAQRRDGVSWSITFQTQMRRPGVPVPFLILGDRRTTVPVWISVENATSELLWLAHPSRALDVRLHVAGRTSETVLALKLVCNESLRIIGASSSSPNRGEVGTADEIPLGPGDGFSVECALARQDAEAFPEGPHGIAFVASGWPQLSSHRQLGDLEFRPPQDTAERKHYLRHEGLVEGRRGNFAGAIGPLEQALNLDSTDAGIAFELAFAHDNLREHDAAAAVLERVFEERTRRGLDTPLAIRNLLAFEHAVQGRNGEARRILKEAGHSNEVIEQELAEAQKRRNMR